MSEIFSTHSTSLHIIPIVVDAKANVIFWLENLPPSKSYTISNCITHFLNYDTGSFYKKKMILLD